MIKGIYTSGSGLMPHVKRQEVTANNLANASTAGYKKDRIFVKELARAKERTSVRETDWHRPMVDNVYTDYTGGVFDRTGNPLDVAIDGDGFFTLQLQDGTQVLTRAGSFVVNSAGQLSFPGGALVTGDGGAITVGDGQVEISADGQVRSDGAVVGRIRPVTVPDLTQLQKLGNSMFVLPEGQETIDIPQSTILQGYLESSNVDIVREMVDMIASYRAYEANARSLQAQDRSLEQLFGRVAGGE